MSVWKNWREPNILINHINGREGIRKWKTTEEAATAAEQKVVESTAAETTVQTVVTDQNLWQAARKAALGAHFNMSADAPAMQEGTITYIFNLK